MALWPLYGKGCLHRHMAGWQSLQTSTKYKHRCKKHTRTHTRVLRGVGWRTRAISQECHPLQLHPCSPFTHSLTRLIVHARLKGRNPCTVFYYFFPPSNWSWSSLLQVPASQSGIQNTGIETFQSTNAFEMHYFCSAATKTKAKCLAPCYFPSFSVHARGETMQSFPLIQHQRMDRPDKLIRPWLEEAASALHKRIKRQKKWTQVA